MKITPLHPWTLSPKEAIALQRQLVRDVITDNRLGSVRYVAGADIATYKDSPNGYAGVVVMTYPELRIVEKKRAAVKLTFPYVPGLLAFREAPVLLEAFRQLEHEPDLILIDGQGLAHPRRFGIACHLGLLLDRPTIGCAKSRLFGHHEEPDGKKGSCSDLYDDRKEIIGAVVRTKDNTQPIYVSIGHKVDLPAAIQYALGCCQGYRLPEPTRQAHMFVGSLRQTGTTKIENEVPQDQLSLLD
jgi:deoxyribonuclease V